MSRTEALRRALAEVWSGAERIDAEAVEDHLADLGFEIVAMGDRRAASKRRWREDPLPKGKLPSSSRLAG